jgi:hypothetical protein
MVDTWNETFDEEEIECLQEGRQYIIFKPNPEDESIFSVKVIDTTLEEGKLSDTSEESSSNISVLIVKGIMHMLDNELDYLAERGSEVVKEEYLSFKKEMFKNSNNVLVFDPNKVKQ